MTEWDSSADFIPNVRAYLEESGYPLELRVAQAAMMTNPISLEQSRYYVDQATGEIRESDVVVRWTHVGEGRRADVYLSIECKAKPVPWVIFDRGPVQVNDPERRLEWALTFRDAGAADPYGDYPKRDIRRLLDYPDLQITLLKASLTGTRVAPGVRGERDSAWAAVMAAASAAVGLEEDLRRTLDRGALKFADFVVFPVVVTSGKLARCSIDGSSSLIVEEIDRGEVIVRMSSDLRQTRVLVVTESALPALLSEAAATPRAL